VSAAGTPDRYPVWLIAFRDHHPIIKQTRASMSEPSLRELESEVTAARERLARDLSTLRSPATLSQFKDELANEAVSAKDALFDKARIEATARVADLVDTLKAKAAANPAAVLAIGAGLAWRLFRHPPITTALVGAGLISLLRTSPGAGTGQSDAAYLDQAKRRLKQQASDVAGGIGEQAGSLAATATDKMQQWNAEVGDQASSLAAKATEKVQQWNAETGAKLRETASGLMEAAKSQATQLSDQASDRLETSWQDARASAARSAAAIGRTSSDLQAALGQDTVADRLLLGAAGVAVATALGIAYQRRVNTPEPVE
jgi:hypothetical protein